MGHSQSADSVELLKKIERVAMQVSRQLVNILPKRYEVFLKYQLKIIEIFLSKKRTGRH